MGRVVDAGSMAPFMRPRRVIVCASLPRNASGKVVKRELRLQILAKGSSREMPTFDLGLTPLARRPHVTASKL